MGISLLNLQPIGHIEANVATRLPCGVTWETGRHRVRLIHRSHLLHAGQGIFRKDGGWE